MSNFYTCPMHPEIQEKKAGTCIKCGMELDAPLAESLALDSQSEGKQQDLKLLKLLILSGIIAIPVFFTEMTPGLSSFLSGLGLKTSVAWINAGLAAISLFYCGAPFIQRAYRALLHKTLNMFSLIVMGTFTAYFYSLSVLILQALNKADKLIQGGVYFETVSVIITLVLAGQVLEGRARRRTKNAIQEILKLSPNMAIRIKEDGSEETIATKEVSIGDILRLRPGDKVPVDGQVTEGESFVDESLFTGEPVALRKHPGKKVMAGTINQRGSFLMRAEKVGSKTFLAEVIAFTAKAQQSRAPIQNRIDNIASVFMIVVLGIATLSFFIWLVVGTMIGLENSLNYALLAWVSTLIIACPCAMGLATPLSITVSMGRAAQNGLLVKDAETMERLSKINTLVIDKTGTLTTAKLTVSHIEVAADQDSHSILSMTASVERQSEHPLAEAIVTYAKERKAPLENITDFQAFAGKGAEANLNGKTVVLGQADFLATKINSASSLLEDLKNRAKPYQEKVQTVVFVAIDGVPAGFLSLSDTIKPQSRQLIAAMRDRGIAVWMATGDSQESADAVAKDLNISHVLARCLPEDKLQLVARLKKNGAKVLMVGDGVNDAPALAAAEVGVAMASGSPSAIESADVSITNNNPLSIVKLLGLARKTVSNLKQNIFLAFIYNGLSVPIAAGLLFPFTGILLSPMVAAIAMMLSSLSVIFSSLRLKNTAIV